jgi:hypothetical protein
VARSAQHGRIGRDRIGYQDVDFLQAQLAFDARAQLRAQGPTVGAGLRQFNQQVDVAASKFWPGARPEQQHPRRQPRHFGRRAAYDLPLVLAQSHAKSIGSAWCGARCGGSTAAGRQLASNGRQCRAGLTVANTILDGACASFTVGRACVSQSR